MVDIKRRPYLTEPGESLLLADSPITTALRFGEFVRDTGIDPNLVQTSPLCAVPLPEWGDFYPSRRWSGLKVEMMWHPLMWLPDHLREPRRITTEGGDTITEPYELYVVRLCLELQESGVYDAASGTWADVLSLASLDIDDEMTRVRLRRWLAGARDDRLDAISLEGYVLDSDDPDWGFDAAAEMTETLTELSYATSAAKISEVLADLAVGDTSPVSIDHSSDTDETEYLWSPGERRSVAYNLVALGDSCLIGASDFSWLDAAEQIRTWSGSEQEMLDGPVAGVRALLDLLVEQFEPSPEEIAQTDQLIAAHKRDLEDDRPRAPLVQAAGDRIATIRAGRQGGMST